MQQPAPHSQASARFAHEGFTLIELLLVIGMMGTLAAIVIVAINPNKHLCQAQNARRSMNMHEIKGAIDAYQAREKIHATGDIPIGEVNAIPICRETVTTDITCRNLDVLIPDYIVHLPQDPLETDANYIGFSLYRSGGGIDLVRADHVQDCINVTD